MNPDKWKSVVISVDTYNELKRVAKTNHRTLSGQFTHLIRRYVDAQSTPAGQPTESEAPPSGQLFEY